MNILTKLLALLTSSSLTFTGPVSDLSVRANEFTELMSDDPVAYAHFQKIQGSLLATDGEYGLYQTFTQHPILGKAFNRLRQAQSDGLEGFSFFSKLNHLQLSEWTEKYKGDRIYQTVVELAQAFGFKKSAIQNLKLYVAPGDANAYTVSGSDNKIIIVIQTGLLKDLSIGQIKAVIAHELMHIRRHHLVVEQMTKMMLALLHSVLVNGLPRVPSEYQPESREEIAAREKAFAALYRPLASVPVVQKLKMAADDKEQEEQQETSDAIPYLMMIENQLRSDQNGLIQLLVNFSLKVADMVEEVGSSPSTADYFREIAQTIYANPHILHNDSIQFNSEKLKFHSQHALGALSQSVETTADRGAASQVPNIKLAAGMARVMGLPFNLEHERMILDQLAKQGDEALDSVTPEALAKFLAKAGDHPLMVLRINNIVNNMPAYPFAFFANRFLKVVLLHQSILEDAFILETQAKHLQPDEEATRPQLNETIQRVNQTLARVWDMITRSLTADVVSGEANPRFRNLAQYILVQREILMDEEITIVQLEKASESAKDPAIQQGLNLRKARLNLSKLMLAKLISRTTEIVQNQKGPSDQERAHRIDVLNKSKTLTDIKAIRDLRMSLTPAVQAGNKKYGRLGVDVASVVNKPKIPVARGKPQEVSPNQAEKTAGAEEDQTPYQITEFATSNCARHFLN